MKRYLTQGNTNSALLTGAESSDLLRATPFGSPRQSASEPALSSLSLPCTAPRAYKYSEHSAKLLAAASPLPSSPKENALAIPFY